MSTGQLEGRRGSYVERESIWSILGLRWLLRHLSGNIELAFGSMRTEVWSRDVNWWLIGIFKAMKSSNERQKWKGPKDWARGPSASGLGEREVNTAGREQSGTRSSQAKKVCQQEKGDHLCQRLLGATAHVVQMCSHGRLKRLPFLTFSSVLQFYWTMTED